MHTERFCPHLDTVPRADLIRAVHHAHLQLSAAASGHLDNLDHGPALESLSACLAKAGHPGFEEAGK